MKELDFVLTLTHNDKIRRSIVSGERKVVVNGLFAVDVLEEEVINAARRMYRDMVHPIVVEEKDGA
jgi:hypothetical protein